MLRRAGIGADIPVRESMAHYSLITHLLSYYPFLLCELFETRNCGRLQRKLAVISNA